MKKFLAIVSSLALALPVSIALPTAAQADALPDLCKPLVPSFYATVGECVSSVRTQGAKVCEQIKDGAAGGFPLAIGGGVVLRNKGECVAYVNAIYRDLINP